MSLKRVITASVTLLGVLALTAAAALVLLTSYLHRTTSSMAEAVDGVRTAEELEVELLTVHRLSSPLMRDQPGVKERLEEAQRSLRSHMVEALRNAQTEDERALLGQTSELLAAYLFVRDQYRHSPPEQQHIMDLNERLDAVLIPLNQLVTFNVNEAREAQVLADHWDNMADVGGVGVAILLILGGSLLLWWMRRSVFAPLFGISQAMRHFGSGHKQTRAPAEGPEELSDMALTFNELANSLERQQQAQLAFLAGVAHDLRNPLSALKMSTALVAPGRAVPEERLHKTMGLVRRQVSRLDRMVGDLLDSTRIEAGRFELSLEAHDARELATSVVDLYQSGGAARELVLEVPEQPVVLHCDATRLEQVLHNLVSNALKYSPDGSPVTVRVSREGAEGVLSVEDRGIGISPEEMHQLFTPFARTGRARETAPGVGIGLSVARHIVEAHGGRFEVDSRPGEGSTFRVRLPLHETAVAPPSEDADDSEPEPDKPPRVH